MSHLAHHGANPFNHHIQFNYQYRGILTEQCIDERFLFRRQVQAGHENSRILLQIPIGKQHVKIGGHGVPVEAADTGNHPIEGKPAHTEGETTAQRHPDFTGQILFNRYRRYIHAMPFSEVGQLFPPLPFFHPVAFGQLIGPTQIQFTAQGVILLHQLIGRRLTINQRYPPPNHGIPAHRTELVICQQTFHTIQFVGSHIDQKVIGRIFGQLPAPLLHQGGTHHHQRHQNRHGPGKPGQQHQCLSTATPQVSQGQPPYTARPVTQSSGQIQ